MRRQDSSKTEFICLMAMFMSITALAIDAVLPALDLIGTSLGAKDANDSQLVIITLFVGMAVGLLLYGPLSDSYGRKRAIYLGMAIFVAGSGVSLAAMNFSVMLAGRLLQGFGIASCRVVSMAMIRDRFEGREMGRVMSLTMVLLIMVPAIAPSIGQLILSASASCSAVSARWQSSRSAISLVSPTRSSASFRPWCPSPSVVPSDRLTMALCRPWSSVFFFAGFLL
jgi:MFS family permease